MDVTRRSFLAGALLGLAEAGLGFPGVARAAARMSPSEKVVVAHVGVGGMGMAHVGWFAGFPDVETAAVCDVDAGKAAGALARLREMRPDTKAVAETDFRRLLERDDIDAITCATPDHWHALVAILAFQAGKHVYGEKPLSYTLAEGQAMQRAAHRSGKVFQLGTQIHAGENYHRVVDLVRAGVVGTVRTVRLWKTGGESTPGFPPDESPPAGLDWDLWLGPAPWRPYNRAIAPFGFRYFWDFSAGVFGDFWCHVADLPFWALELGAPKSVLATGSDPLEHMVTTPPFMDAELEFPNLKLFWHSRPPEVPGAAGKDLGIQFEGDKGSLVADYDTCRLFVDGKAAELPDVPRVVPRSPGHQRNFLDCVKSGGVPESNIDHAVRMTLPMHLASISYRLGRKLTWDGEKMEFVGDAAANRLRHRPYRAPWVLPA